MKTATIFSVCWMVIHADLYFLAKHENSYAYIIALISRIRIVVAVLCIENKIYHIKLKYICCFEIYRTLV